jgi:hypothetical protein
MGDTSRAAMLSPKDKPSETTQEIPGGGWGGAGLRGVVTWQGGRCGKKVRQDG